MKKLFLASLFLCCFSIFSNAQAGPAQTTPVKAKKPATTAVAAKPDKTSVVKPATGTSATSAPTKKDGTPDMRYKSNKDAAKKASAPTHLKKDGTADKRYKENKK
ncbi:MAG: hypothetical protein M3N30_03975 [Bacteroidota bacterium]|nr:hypothetical protein [Bacteroidota bacterium]